MPLLPEIKLGATPDDDKIGALVRQLNVWARLISTEAHAADFGEGTIYLKNNQLILKKPSGEEIILAGQQDLNAPITEDSNFLAITANSIEANSITADQISSLNFSGKTAVFDTGSIGGFDLGADYIRDSADTFGMASTVTGGDDVRFWAGNSFANRANAPFRVTEAGIINATDVKIGTQVRVIVPASESGVEPDIQAVIDAVADGGGGVVTLRNGVYSPSADIVLKPNVVLEGETAGGVIIDFASQALQIKAVGTNIYDTGTVSVDNLATTVTGVGTTWDTGMIGQSILLDGVFYVIDDVTSTTTLEIEIPFELTDLSGADYVICDPASDIVLKNLTIENSTHADGAFYSENSQYIIFDTVNVYSSTIGVQFLNCYSSSFIGSFISDCGVGLKITTANTWTLYNFQVYASTGDNIVVENFNNVSFSNFTNSTAGGNGITATNCRNWGLYDFTSQSVTAIGVEFIDCFGIEVFGANVQSSGSDGIKLTSGNTGIIISSMVFVDNGGYGINIADSSSEDTVLAISSFTNNTSGDYDDNGTDTIIIEPNAVDSVNGQTGTVVLDQDDVGDGTTYKQYSQTEKTKLAGIETGADVTDEANVTDALDGAILTNVGTPASTDKILLQDASDSDNLKYAEFSEFGGGGGSGDVVGPSSSIDNTVAVFDGTTGKLIKDASNVELVETTGPPNATELRLHSPDGTTITGDNITLRATDNGGLGLWNDIGGADIYSSGDFLLYSIDAGVEIQALGTGENILLYAPNGAVNVDSSSGIHSDIVNEYTLNNGVVIESVTIKDGLVDGRDVSADGTKLDGIESGADVTDATNVDAAGATMNTDTSLAGNSYFLDEDNMASDSPSKVPSQQSVKAYVDSSVAGAGGGDVSSDTGTSVDGEVVLFKSTSGKLVKRATITGLAKLASGVLSAAVAGTDYTTPTGTETISNKTMGSDLNMATYSLLNAYIPSPVLTTPQINDTSENHQYILSPSELAADRTVTLPLLTGNDTLVFEAHSQTLTNKTIDGDNNTLQDIPSTALKEAFFRGRYQSNTTNSAPTGLTVQFGWGFLSGGGANSNSETVTFPAAFSSVPIVLISLIGAKAGSDPSGPGDATASTAGQVSLAGGTTASTFEAQVSHREASGTLSATTRYLYSWIAIGAV